MFKLGFAIAAVWLLASVSADLSFGQAAVLHKLAAPKAAAPATDVPEVKPSAAAPASLAIPLPQVADEGEELDRKLAEINSSLQTRQDQLDVVSTVTTQAKEIKDRSLQVNDFLRGVSDVLELRDELVYWKSLDHRASEQRRLLAAKANELQSQILQLDQEQVRWQATNDQIHDTAGIEVVANRVQQELAAIASIRSRAQEQLNQVLTLQNQLSQTTRQISGALTQLGDAEDKFRSHLFERDSQPLWAPLKKQSLNQPMPALLRRAGDQDFRTANEFLRSGGPALLLGPALFFLTLFGTFKLKKNFSTISIPDLPGGMLPLVARPYSISLLITLFGALAQTGNAPLSITLLFYILWLWVIFRLSSVFLKPALLKLVYPLLGLNLLEFLRVAIPMPAIGTRLTLTALLLACALIYGWFVQTAELRKLGLSDRATRYLRLSIGVGVSFVTLGLIANICGLVSLSHVLGIGTMLSAFLAVALYCAVRVFYLLLAIYLNSSLVTSFTGEVRQRIELWSKRAIAAFAIVIWFLRSEFYLFLLQDVVNQAISSALAISIGIGAVRFTVANILSVVLILAVGYGLAKGLSSLLRSILAARLSSHRGLPYAISKVTYYCLLLVVFALALANAGVELNKFTVITGALGVGVGFGLQNIVSNFASGLILLFERPIRVGDVIEVGGLIGSVRRIGARSSTLTTAQGAEVIVPNSNLLSNQVINWTLSSPWRRVEIPVGVAYGSNPQAVLDLLVSVASKHEGVMTVPGPEAFFLGFGDSALNFELRFWSERQETWFRLKSDVTIDVSDALRNAGIEIPFPQRDLHLRSSDMGIQSLAVSSVQTGPMNGTQTSPPAASAAVAPER